MGRKANIIHCPVGGGGSLLQLIRKGGRDWVGQVVEANVASHAIGIGIGYMDVAEPL
jgi:hypothetical protein